MTPRPDLLLVGVSTRALAASVLRSGFRGSLVSLDLFADSDQERLCRCLTPGRDLPGPRRTSTLLRAAAALRPRRVAFAGGMETHPRLLADLERRAPILGNRARAVREVRDPAALFAFLAAQGIPHPRTWARPRGAAAGGEARALARAGRLLWKPRRGGGGLRVRPLGPWSGALRRGAGPGAGRGGYLQERADGTPGSVAIVADGRSCRILGYSRILAGEPGLGGSGFAYCGNLWGPPGSWLPARARSILRRAAALLTRRFSLRGLNGIDFVLAGGRPLLLEVNPRYTASMELIEEGWGRSLFALHRDACRRGRLPGPRQMPRDGIPARGWIGKGILYAARTLRVADLRPFLRARARDVPRAGSVVPVGSPLCTLLARGSRAPACRRLLLARAALLRRSLGAAGRERRAS